MPQPAKYLRRKNSAHKDTIPFCNFYLFLLCSVFWMGCASTGEISTAAKSHHTQIQFTSIILVLLSLFSVPDGLCLNRRDFYSGKISYHRDIIPFCKFCLFLISLFSVLDGLSSTGEISIAAKSHRTDSPFSFEIFVSFFFVQFSGWGVPQPANYLQRQNLIAWRYCSICNFRLSFLCSVSWMCCATPGEMSPAAKPHHKEMLFRFLICSYLLCSVS